MIPIVTRKEQKEQRRLQILNTALDLFICKGFAATKISDIAANANISTGLLFHYFDSKESLYMNLIDTGISSSKETLLTYSATPDTFFETLTKNLLEQIEKNPFVIKMFVLMSQAFENDFLSKKVKEDLKNDNIEQTVKMIKLGQSKGTIRSGDPLALAVTYWATIQGLCQIMITNPKLPIPTSDWILSILKNN